MICVRYSNYSNDSFKVLLLVAPAATVFQAIQGHWLSACLGVLMDLKIPEILAGQQSPVEFKQVTLQDDFMKLPRMSRCDWYNVIAGAYAAGQASRGERCGAGPLLQGAAGVWAMEPAG